MIVDCGWLSYTEAEQASYVLLFAQSCMQLMIPMWSCCLLLIVNLHTTNVATDKFLADRTNGRAYAAVFRLSSVRLWRYVLWLNGAS